MNNKISGIIVLILILSCGDNNKKKSMFSPRSSKDDDNIMIESENKLTNEFSNTLEAPLSLVNSVMSQLPQTISLSPNLSMPKMDSNMAKMMIPMALTLATGRGRLGMEAQIASQVMSMAMNGNGNSGSGLNIGSLVGSLAQSGGGSSLASQFGSMGMGGGSGLNVGSLVGSLAQSVGFGNIDSSSVSQFGSMGMGGGMNLISPQNLGSMAGSMTQIGGAASGMAMAASNPMSAATSGAAGVLGAVDSIFGFGESHKQDSMRVQGRENRKTLKVQGNEQRKTIEKQGQEQRKTIRVAGDEKRKTVRVIGDEKRKTVRVIGDEKRKTVRTMGKEQRLIQDNAQKHRVGFLNRSVKHKKDILKLGANQERKTVKLKHSNNMQVMKTSRQTMRLVHIEQRKTVSLKHSNNMTYMRGNTLNKKDIIRYQSEHEKNNMFLRKQNELELNRIKTRQQLQIRKHDHDLLLKRDKIQYQNQDLLNNNQHKRGMELKESEYKYKSVLSKQDHQQTLAHTILSLDKKHKNDKEIHNLMMDKLYHEHNQNKELANINHELTLQRQNLDHRNQLELKRHEQGMLTKQHTHDIHIQEKQHKNQIVQIQKEHKEQRQTDKLRSNHQIDLEEKKFRQKLFFNNLDALKTNLPELDIKPIIERKKIIQKVSQGFCLEEKENEWSKPNSKISLFGYPGIGKTTLAMVFGHQYFENPYEMVWWIDCLDEDTIHSSVRKIAWQLAMKEALGAKIQDVIFYINLKISQQKIKWLVIWDNVDDISIYNKYRHMNLYPNIGGHILLTSRNFCCPNPITIPSFTIKESTKLISQINKPAHAHENKEMNHLIDKSLKGLPLATSQSGQHMSDRMIFYSKYNHFRNNSPSKLNKTEKPVRSYNRNLTLLNVIEKTINDLKENNKEIEGLVKIISVLDNNKVPIYFLESCTTDQYAFYEEIAELRKSGLIINNLNVSINIHPTFQDIFYNKMDFKEKVKTLSSTSQYLTSVLNEYTLKDLAPHIYSVWKKMTKLYEQSDQKDKLDDTSQSKLNKSIASLIPVMIQVADFYLLISDESTYSKIISSALKISESEKGLDSNLPQLYTYHAHYHLAKNNIRQAKESYDKLIKKCESIESKESKEIKLLLSIYKYGLTLFKNKEYNKAKYTLEKLLKSQKELDPFVILNSKVLLGKIAFMAEDHKETINLLTQALHLAIKQNDVLSIAICNHLIGKTYYQLFKADDSTLDEDKYLNLAQSYQEKALRYYLKINNNEGIASANAALGFIHFSNGKIESSVTYFENSWQLYFTTMGLDDENTSLIWEYIIDCYDNIGIKKGMGIVDVASMRGRETVLQKLLMDKNPIDNNLIYKEIMGLYLQQSKDSEYLSRSLVYGIVMPRTLSYMIQQYIGYHKVMNTRTPYFYATSPMIIKILHYNNININQTDEHGISPYLYHKTRNSDIKAALDKLGADHWCSGSKRIYKYKGMPGKIRSIDLSSKNHLAALDNKNNIALWDRGTKKNIYNQTIKKTKGQNSVVFSPLGSILAIAGNPLSLMNISNDYDCEKIKLNVNCVSFISGNIIALGIKDSNYALIYDINKQSEVSKIYTNDDIRDILYDKENNLLIAGCNDGKLILWDYKTLKSSSLDKCHKDRINKVARSTVKYILASTSDDSCVKIWDIRNLKKVKTFENDDFESPEDISFSHRNPNVLSVAYSRKFVQFWNVDTISQIETDPLDDTSLLTLKFCPDSNLLYMGSEGIVKEWDTPNF